MCWPKPSATSSTPIRIRNESASILIVGCCSTKLPIACAKSSMTPIATTTARTMTHRVWAMPTAVITESSEKTRSSSRIWTMTPPNEAATRAGPCRSPPSRLSWISQVAFASRNRPPPIRTRSRPETSWPSTLNSGLVSEMTQLIPSSRPMRMNIASERPMRHARGRCAGGSFPVRIEMKTMLSTPSTISSSVSVSRATRFSPLRISVTGLLRWGSHASDAALLAGSPASMRRCASSPSSASSD